MFVISTLFILITLIINATTLEEKYFTVEMVVRGSFGDEPFAVGLGQPPQYFSVQLDFGTKEFIVVDVECGRSQGLCPKYCQSGMYLLNIYTNKIKRF